MKMRITQSFVLAALVFVVLMSLATPIVSEILWLAVRTRYRFLPLNEEPSASGAKLYGMTALAFLCAFIVFVFVWKKLRERSEDLH